MASSEERTFSSIQGASMFVWGIWALMLLVNLIIVSKYSLRYPFADELNVLNEPHTPKWLWEQYFEHRLPLAKLIWLGSLRLTNYNSAVGNSISVLTVGAAAFVMIWTARRLRGWTSFADVFFPLAFLNFGQGLNFLWSWSFHYLLAPSFACCVLSIILVKSKKFDALYAILTGACLVLLSLSGPGGLPYVIALAIWAGYQVSRHWRSAANVHAKRKYAIAMCLTGLAVLLVVLYFVGYERGRGVATYFPPGGLKASIRTGIQVLSISFGPGIGAYWRAVGLAVLALLVLSSIPLMRSLFKEPTERARCVGLLLFIASVGSLILAVGRSRSGMPEAYILSGSYLNMALPALSWAYFVWMLYGRAGISNLLHMSLCFGMCLFSLSNFVHGQQLGEHFRRAGQAFEHDMRAGVPPFILAERHIDLLDPGDFDARAVENLAGRLRRMQQAGLPQFRDMAGDPAFREVPLPSVPVQTNQVTWDHGVSHSCSQQPSQASLDFALGEPRFVYAIRLTYEYRNVGGRTDGLATFRMSWGAGNPGNWVKGGATGCQQGATFFLPTGPPHIWAAMRKRPPTLTVWVNSTIDRFRMCPDTGMFAFAVPQIKLLVPR